MRNSLLFLLLSLSALKAELTIPALTAYGVPDPNAIRMNKARGVVDWKDPAQKVVWYGEFKKAGEVTAAVSVKLPKAAVSKLKLTLGGKSSEATVTGTDDAQVVKFGNFTLAKAGYAPIELTSLNAAGTAAGDIANTVTAIEFFEQPRSLAGIDPEPFVLDDEFDLVCRMPRNHVNGRSGRRVSGSVVEQEA